MFDFFLEALLVAQLQIVNLAVKTLLWQAVGVRAALDDAAFIHHQDQVGPADGRQALGNHKGCAALHQACQRFLDQVFGLGIHAGG